jgi:signal transduction histidine kinase
LTNLIFNAVDAMPGGGIIEVNTSALTGCAPDGTSSPYVRLELIDCGIGMDEETRRRCLEPFFTTKGERGTGLGLAMVYGMAQRHNVSLEIDSKCGAGTTMRLLFPVHASTSTCTSPPTVRMTAALSPVR